MCIRDRFSGAAAVVNDVYAVFY
ncbi:hypothetical protein AZZ69_000553, partial [Klebsiella pneumoniae]